MTSVLIVRLSAMGDLVHGLGAIQALHRARPDWELTVVTQQQHAALIAGVDGIARVVEFDRRGGVSALRRLRRELRQRDYDVALDFQGNWKSAFIAWLSAARDRVGAGGRWRQEPMSRWLLRRTIEVPGPDHPAIVASALVRSLAADATFAAARLTASPAEIAAEQAALTSIGVDAGRPFLVVVVTAPTDPRALPPAVIAAETAASELPVVHLLGPAEAVLPAPLPPVAPLAATLRHEKGQSRRLVALGAIVAQTGGAVIGPDQGASHVLTAAGARCRVLFGAQDPRRTAPVAATALVHPRPPDCSPCRQRRCTHDRGTVCMEFASIEGREVPFSVPDSLSS